MVYAFWVCQWVLTTLSHIFHMWFYFKTWCMLMIFFSWETHKLHWAFCFHVSFVDLLISLGIFFFFPIFFSEFWGDIMGIGSWESIQGPLARHQVRSQLFFGGINILSVEVCAPFAFLGSWVLVFPYLYFRFHIFDRPVWEEYVFQVKGSPHLFQSCLDAVRDTFPPIAK